MNPAVVIIVVGLVGLGGTTYVMHEAGYLPVAQLLETKEPVEYQPVCSSCIEKHYQSIIQDIPNLDKIKYNFYISGSNYLEVHEDYKKRLKKEGYTEKVSGVKTIKNVTIHYYGFIKGITAVGIAIANGEDLSYPEAQSVILYSTGNVLDYQKIIEWYYNGSDGKNIKNLSDKVSNTQGGEQ